MYDSALAGSQYGVATGSEQVLRAGRGLPKRLPYVSRPVAWQYVHVVNRPLFGSPVELVRFVAAEKVKGCEATFDYVLHRGYDRQYARLV